VATSPLWQARDSQVPPCARGRVHPGAQRHQRRGSLPLAHQKGLREGRPGRLALLPAQQRPLLQACALLHQQAHHAHAFADGQG
jgi:hypothetical protein